MRVSRTVAGCHLIWRLPAMWFSLRAIVSRQANGLIDPVVTGRSIQYHRVHSALSSSNDPNQYSEQVKIGRTGEDNDAVNLRYRNQIDDLRTKLRSLEKQVEFGPSDALFDDQSTDYRVDLGSMVKMEEFRAKLRVAEQQASGVKPVSAVDVFLQSFNGNLQPTVSLDSVRPTFESGPESDLEIPPSPVTLRPSSLPTEAEELQRMVMAYHRFTKYSLENAEKEKKKAVREAEERMKKKYLPIIAELEKANAELKGNQKQKFRLF